MGFGENKSLYWEPPTKCEATVECKVSDNSDSGGIIFQYTVHNEKNSIQKIRRFEIEYTTDIYNIIKSSTADARRYPKESWKPSKFPHKEIYRWYFGYYTLIKQGESEDKIGFSTKGLPGIVHCYIESESRETSNGWTKVPDEFIDLRPSGFKTKLHGKTVGAVEWFKTTDEGIKRLEEYANESFTQGWIETQEAKYAILSEIKELKSVMNSLHTGVEKQAAVDKFMDKIQKLFSEKKILSEACALLYYNSRALSNSRLTISGKRMLKKTNNCHHQLRS